MNPDIDIASLTRVVSSDFLDADGQQHLCTYARLAVESRPAAIEIFEPINHASRKSAFFALHAAFLIGSTAMLGAVLAVVAGGTWVGRPLRRLIDKTRRIGDGDLSGPLKMDRNDEFGELATALNSMCDQLQSAQEEIQAEGEARLAAINQLRHADRLRTVGRLAAGLAHELGTPLNVVSGRAGLISSGRLSEEETRKSAIIIKTEADRIASIIRQLLDFARRNSPQRKSIDVIGLTQQTIQMLAPIAEKNDSHIELSDSPDRLLLHIDSGQIQQVLTNLIVNAVASMPTGGPVQVSVHQLTTRHPEDEQHPPAPYAQITVTDQGEGISPEILDQIFEPFFTTKDVGEGTGLGLSIAYGIVQEHGGWIDVASELGQGSRFTVYLPLEEASCKDES